jgi:WD40 repeat protein
MMARLLLLLSAAVLCICSFAANGLAQETKELWTVKTGKTLDTIRVLAFSPDGKILAAGSRVVSLWSAADGKELATLKGTGERISSLAWTSDSKTLVSGSYDGSINIWDIEQKKEKASFKFKGSTDQFTAVAVSPDGKFLATRRNLDGYCQLWDMDTQKELQKSINEPPTDGLSIAFTEDSKMLISATVIGSPKGQQGMVHQLLVPTLKLKIEMKKYPPPIDSLAITGDGRTVLARTGAQLNQNTFTWKIWDSATQKELSTIKRP